MQIFPHDGSMFSITFKLVRCKIRNRPTPSWRKKRDFLNFRYTCQQCQLSLFRPTSRVPVEGKSSVCLICMKYRILILIIIIISLGNIILSSSYIANTSRMHARMHIRAHARGHTRAHTHTPPSPLPYRLSIFVGAQPWPPAPLATIPVVGSFK